MWAVGVNVPREAPSSANCTAVLLVFVAVTLIVSPPAALPPTARAVSPLGSASRATVLTWTNCVACWLTTPLLSVAE